MDETSPMASDGRNQKIEVDLVLEAIYQKYGYDFRGYSKASIRRRIKRHFAKSGLSNISDMIPRLLYDPDFFDRLLLDLTINVTEMFRDPAFFRELREAVVPELKQRGFVKIWHAGCATGEEVYSMAILLREEGFFNNYRIYATDANEAVLAAARKGIFPLSRMKAYTANYLAAGGRAAFSSYYTARFDFALMHQDLKQHMVFSHHNLVTDGAFGEMDLILCRNVMIYFNRELQGRVLELFKESLSPGGYLCLGSKETIRYASVADGFATVSEKHRIYSRTAGADEE